MKLSRRFFSLLIIGGLCFNCGSGNKDNGTHLTVAVAANVQFAMKAIEEVYETTTKQDINIVIGSSGKLTAQITQGAPYDVFISANLKYPNYLYEKGLASHPPNIYALGSLVLWTMDKELDLKDDLEILETANIQKIALANPKNAPYGEQAIKVLEYYGIEDKVNQKLVYGESIAQTNQYIITRNCEIGFTAKSVVMAPQMKGKGQFIPLNPAAYQPITQGVIITKYGTKNNLEIANRFYDFLFSPTAQRIFEAYGYTIPSAK